jgi:hypothetical protein
MLSRGSRLRHVSSDPDEAYLLALRHHGGHLLGSDIRSLLRPLYESLGQRRKNLNSEARGSGCLRMGRMTDGFRESVHPMNGGMNNTNLTDRAPVDKSNEGVAVKIKDYSNRRPESKFGFRGELPRNEMARA